MTSLVEFHANSKRLTSSNQEVLQNIGLFEQELTLINGDEQEFEISWRQISKERLKTSEEYISGKYFIAGDELHICTVFFVSKFFQEGDLPETINTKGYIDDASLNKNLALHYGFSKRGKECNSVYFVLHQNDWEPFQHQFRKPLGRSDEEFLKFANTIKWSGNLIATTAVGTYIAWAGAAALLAGGPVALGTAVSTVVGGYVAKDFALRVTGDYLRYIG